MWRKNNITNVVFYTQFPPYFSLWFSARMEADYVTPIIIAVASLATAAGPVAAILIYISRKAKINGSYSLVNSLKAKV